MNSGMIHMIGINSNSLSGKPNIKQMNKFSFFDTATYTTITVVHVRKRSLIANYGLLKRRKLIGAYGGEGGGGFSLKYWGGNP